MASAAGRKIYNSVRWRRIRREIFKRDRFKCVTCGGSGRLECHHKKEVALGGSFFDAVNLETICRSCHINLTAKGNRRTAVAARDQLRELANAEI